MGNIDLGKAFQRSWEIFSKNIVAFVVGALLAVIIGTFSLLILYPVMMGGLFYMIKKADEGQTPEIGDVFKGFSNFGSLFVGGLISFLAVLVGALACGVGALVTSGIVVFMLPLIVEGSSAGDAWSKCWAGFKGNWLGFVVVSLISGIVMGAGNIAIYIGSLFTIPFGMCLVWTCYKQAFAAPTAAVAPPPVAPPSV